MWKRKKNLVDVVVKKYRELSKIPKKILKNQFCNRSECLIVVVSKLMENKSQNFTLFYISLH